MTPDSSRKLFLCVLVFTLAVRAVLAAAIPITGDEAYFVLWGRHLDYGYYDHPPMVGWLLYALLPLGGSELVVRLPALLIPPILALAIQRTLRPRDETKAWLVATLWLVLPLDVVNIFITSDTPLVLFATLSVLALYRAWSDGPMGWYAFSGAALGLAFLSKYFAVLLGVAYLVLFLVRGADRRAWRGFALLLLSSAPFVLINLAWNYQHCWNNVLFNLYSRNLALTWSPQGLAMFAGMLVYVLTPWLLLYLWRQRRGVRALLGGHAAGAVFLYTLVVPLLLLGLVAVRRTIGLHWVLAFLPILPLLAFTVLDARQLRRSVFYSAAFSVLHLALLGAVLTTPLELWRDSGQYRNLVMGTQPETLLARIDAEAPAFHLGTGSYTSASVLAFYGERHVLVFGDGSYHARQDDLLTDFRALDGENIAVLAKSEASAARAEPFFARTELRIIELEGASFRLVLGYNFDFATYKKTVLSAVRDRYYRIPPWLPAGSCYFCERYFPDADCR